MRDSRPRSAHSFFGNVTLITPAIANAASYCGFSFLFVNEFSFIYIYIYIYREREREREKETEGIEII